MSLHIVATPIGPLEDIGQRALEFLSSAEAIIGEEPKATRRRLRSWGLPLRDIHFLNEHSTDEDLHQLLELCREKRVVLISDCGTPGFCDPGAHLVRLCQKSKVPVHSIPGPSSLMAFLSICGERVDQFYFRGFLPRKKDLRQSAWKELRRRKEPIVIMDTPYRLQRTLEETQQYLPQTQCILGVSLSQEDECIDRGTAQALLKRWSGEKREFLLLMLP
jgi:16S rRNA (cytidine1402-2'-O)-methyltransferase